jgi:hypothetical protein
VRRASIFLMAFACFPVFGLAKDATTIKKLELGDCTAVPGLPKDARCGTYEVWENRAAKSGRFLDCSGLRGSAQAAGPAARGLPGDQRSGGPLLPRVGG